MRQTTKPTWHQVATRAQAVEMFPEVAFHESSNARMTAHSAPNGFYAIAKVEQINTEDIPFTVTSVYKSETREGILLCVERFAQKFPK